MYLIVGLGNPEPEYCFTRHNLGFDVLNKISEKYDIKSSRADHGKHDKPDCHIPVQIRILTGFSGNPAGEQNSAQHGDGDHDSVHGNREISNCKGFWNIVEINPKMRERNVHLAHDIRHKTVSLWFDVVTSPTAESFCCNWHRSEDLYCKVPDWGSVYKVAKSVICIETQLFAIRWSGTGTHRRPAPRNPSLPRARGPSLWPPQAIPRGEDPHNWWPLPG